MEWVVETKRRMEALGKWDEQADIASANELQPTQRKSVNSQKQSQKMLLLWGSSHVIFTVTGYPVSCRQCVFKFWMS